MRVAPALCLLTIIACGGGNPAGPTPPAAAPTPPPAQGPHNFTGTINGKEWVTHGRADWNSASTLHLIAGSVEVIVPRVTHPGVYLIGELPKDPLTSNPTSAYAVISWQGHWFQSESGWLRVDGIEAGGVRGYFIVQARPDYPELVPGNVVVSATFNIDF